MKLKDLAKEIKEWRERKGFITPSCITDKNGEVMLGKLMLVVSEIGEAAEAIRHNNLSNFEEEIADTLIRLLDICGTMEIDPEEIIKNKMVVNEKRPIRHGTKITL